MSRETPSFLHPRAVRMGLERVIEHQRVTLQEHGVLTTLYETHLQAEPLALNPAQVRDFLSRDSKASQEDWVQQFFKA